MNKISMSVGWNYKSRIDGWNEGKEIRIAKEAEISAGKDVILVVVETLSTIRYDRNNRRYVNVVKHFRYVAYVYKNFDKNRKKCILFYETNVKKLPMFLSVQQYLSSDKIRHYFIRKTNKTLIERYGDRIVAAILFMWEH